MERGIEITNWILNLMVVQIIMSDNQLSQASQVENKEFGYHLSEIAKSAFDCQITIKPSGSLGKAMGFPNKNY